MIILLKSLFLFDYKNSRGDNSLQIWADELPMQEGDRGRLDSKIDMLARAGDNLPPRLLQPTKEKHIMEIAVNGRIAIRLMLCRGPFSMKDEFTFLFGTLEKNRKYIPRDAPKRADTNRSKLLLDRKRRCRHEPFQKLP